MQLYSLYLYQDIKFFLHICLVCTWLGDYQNPNICMFPNKDFQESASQNGQYAFQKRERGLTVPRRQYEGPTSCLLLNFFLFGHEIPQQM